MPIISAYIDPAQVSTVVVKPPKEIHLYNFPFSYSQNLFGHFTDEKRFYSDVLKYVARKFGIKFSEADILVCGFFQPPKLDAHLTMSAMDILMKETSYSVYVENESSATLFGKEVSNEILNFLSNKSIAMQMKPSKQDQFFLDRSVSAVVGINTFKKDTPLLFTGNRYSHTMIDSESAAMAYLFSLNRFNNPGICELYLDPRGLYFPLRLIQHYDKTICSKLDVPEFSMAGTFLNVPDNVECLFHTDVETSQFFEVKKGQLFIVPLDPDSRARVQVKSDAFGQYEGVIRGGKLGFVIDTRDKSDMSKFKDRTLFGEYQKYIEKAIIRL